MEFKSLEKWRVQQKFNLSDSQFDYVISNVIRRHPLENWIINRVAQNGQQVVYIKQEFVLWLEKVYFNKEKFYLDLEIDFFMEQIIRLENELNISHYEFQYEDISLKDLRDYFQKNKNIIGVAVNRMERRNNKSYKYIKDGRVYISKEGVKWLSENYFRESYLKNLELYKLELQKYKRRKYGKR